MKSNKAKNILLFILVIGLVGMTIAYAALSQRLDINSTANVKASTWDIHFKNLSSANKTGTANVVTEPTLTNTAISGLNVELQKPGDSVTYTFDIENAGTIDAKIGQFKINTKEDGILCTDSEGSTTSSDATSVCNNLSYTLSYTNETTDEQTGQVINANAELGSNQELKAGKTVNVTLKISYDGDAVPTNDVTITGLDAYIIYEQN